MKKIYINLPILGRMEKDISASILKIKKIAEILLDDECEVLETSERSLNIKDPADWHRNIIDVSNDIKILANADYFVNLETYGVFDDSKEIEEQVARYFKIPRIDIPNRDVFLICPDLEEIQKQMEANSVKQCNTCSCCSKGC